MIKKLIIQIIVIVAFIGLTGCQSNLSPECYVLLSADGKYVITSLQNEQRTEINTFGYDIYRNMIHINKPEDYIFFSDSENKLQWIHIKDGIPEKYEISAYPKQFFADENIVVYSSENSDGYGINYFRYDDFVVRSLPEYFSCADFISNGDSVIVPYNNYSVILSLLSYEKYNIDIDYMRIVSFDDNKIYYSDGKYIGEIFIADFIKSLDLNSGEKHTVAYNPLDNAEHMWISENEGTIVIDGIIADNIVNTNTYILEYHGLFREKTNISGEQVIQYFSY